LVYSDSSTLCLRKDCLYWFMAILFEFLHLLGYSVSSHVFVTHICFSLSVFIAMMSLKTWCLSQEANKVSGVCSVCLNVTQLRLKDGLVHRHGPRHNRDAGSHKSPLAITSSQTDSPACDSEITAGSSCCQSV
jgi:hypothetical protein